MQRSYWESVVADGMRVPTGRSLAGPDRGARGDARQPRPQVRDDLAYPVLASWISSGVYDHLLRTLGNGLCVLMEDGVGRVTGDSVFHRSFAVLVLAEIIERDTRMDVVDDRALLGWGDRIATWLVAEKDLRGYVQGRGWAHAVAHGADAVGALARSPRIDGPALGFLLDVIADRVLEPTPEFWVAGEPDRLAFAAMVALRRDLLEMDTLDPWLRRLAARAEPVSDDLLHPFRVNGNVQAFLRALYLQLQLAQERLDVAVDANGYGRRSASRDRAVSRRSQRRVRGRRSATMAANASRSGSPATPCRRRLQHPVSDHVERNTSAGPSIRGERARRPMTVAPRNGVRRPPCPARHRAARPPARSRSGRPPSSVRSSTTSIRVSRSIIWPHQHREQAMEHQVRG